jgi:hypothetical protein
MSCEMKTSDLSDDGTVTEMTTTMSSNQEAVLLSSSSSPRHLPPPPFEEELPNMIEWGIDNWNTPSNLQRDYGEPVEEWAARIYEFVSTLLLKPEDINRLLQAINLSIHYNMIATLNYALSEFVTDPTVLDVPNQRSPLYMAIYTPNAPAVEILLAKGVSTNVPRFVYSRNFTPIRDDWSPLMYACYLRGTRELPIMNDIAMLLIRYGCDINHQSEDFQSGITRNALTIAAYQQNWFMVAYLLEKCDDHLKEGVLEIYRQFATCRVHADGVTNHRVDWNAIRYKNVIRNILSTIHKKYENDSIKFFFASKMIDFLGYNKKEFVDVVVPTTVN